jgi:hypothetical protein
LRCERILTEFDPHSNYIRNDLQSSNEYVRGVTMRFLCKLREPELLEPLIPSCRTGLVSWMENAHSDVNNAQLLLPKSYRSIVMHSFAETRCLPFIQSTSTLRI